MSKAVQNIEANKRAIRDINTEYPSASLTIRITAAQAIATTGTSIVFNTEVRSQAIAWSGSDVTIPTDGYYAISIPVRTSVVNTFMRCAINLNGVNVNSYTESTPAGTTQNIYYFNFMRYLRTDDVLKITLFPQVNCNITAVNEFGVESGILNITQLTAAIE